MDIRKRECRCRSRFSRFVRRIRHAFGCFALVPIRATQSSPILQKCSSRPHFPSICKKVAIDYDDYESVDLPIGMATLVLDRCGLFLYQLFDCNHHLQSQIPPLRKVSRTVSGADLSTACSSPCLSRRSSFGCDTLSRKIRYVTCFTRRLRASRLMICLGTIVRYAPNRLIFNTAEAMRGNATSPFNSSSLLKPWQTYMAKGEIPKSPQVTPLTHTFLPSSIPTTASTKRCMDGNDVLSAKGSRQQLFIPRSR